MTLYQVQYICVTAVVSFAGPQHSRAPGDQTQEVSPYLVIILTPWLLFPHSNNIEDHKSPEPPACESPGKAFLPPLYCHLTQVVFTLRCLLRCSSKSIMMCFIISNISLNVFKTFIHMFSLLSEWHTYCTLFPGHRLALSLWYTLFSPAHRFIYSPESKLYISMQKSLWRLVWVMEVNGKSCMNRSWA